MKVQKTAKIVNLRASTKDDGTPGRAVATARVRQEPEPGKPGPDVFLLEVKLHTEDPAVIETLSLGGSIKVTLEA